MFNFLVAGMEGAWSKGIYSFPKSRVAVEYTEDSISERYRDLTDDVVQELLELPAVFAIEGEEEPSRIGRITSITQPGSDVVIRFEFSEEFPPIDSGVISENSLFFEIGGWEMSRTHWAIKRGDLNKILREIGHPGASGSSLPSIQDSFDSLPEKANNQVFIVHGHDDVAKYEMAAELKRHGLKPIILHEQASGGMTIIEKIEYYSNVGFGVVLYTPCDIGGKHSTEMNLSPRARQNVVFEHGYLIAKLGRSRVMAFVKGRIETPNDISGVLYIGLDSESSWKVDLNRELRQAGYSTN